MEKIKAAVVGSTGYAGEELARLLYNHKFVKVKYLTSKTYLGQRYSDVYQNFNHITEIECQEDDLDEIAKDADVIFLALPHGIASKKVNENILSKAKVIDLGADFRLFDKKIYESWYEVEHFSPKLLNEAVYGLCEIHREKIKNARLVANPGCYTTCSILSLYPLFAQKLIDVNMVIIDAKSGVSGAGRSANLGTHYCETNESIKAYKITAHRHTPEIEQELSLAFGSKINVQFTPHLTPMNRGILAACYARLKDGINEDDVKEAYQKQYGKEIFIRLLKDGISPETKWVKGTNFADIGIFVDSRTRNVIVMGAIDNLIKGAAGQAIQNMNLMFGFDENEGLLNAGIFPA